MLVLALDPGETVGFAVVGDDNKPVFSGGFPQDAIPFWINFLGMNYPITDIIIEASPYFVVKKDRAWVEIQDALREHIPDEAFATVSPGTWKPMKDVLSLMTDSFSTQHEKDAVMIARWFIRNQKAKNQ